MDALSNFVESGLKEGWLLVIVDALDELIRRVAESYAQTCPEVFAPIPEWIMPVLRGSGRHLTDPAKSFEKNNE